MQWCSVILEYVRYVCSSALFLNMELNYKSHNSIRPFRDIRGRGKHERSRCVMDSCLLSVAEQLFKDLQRTYTQTKHSADAKMSKQTSYHSHQKRFPKACTPVLQFPDDLLIALRFVFGPCALQALDLVEKHSVKCVTSPSGRKVFQVLGGSGRLYTCYSSCHYCPCPAFSFSVLRRNESVMCKHLLAACLSQAMGLCQQEQVSDQQMTHVLSGQTEANT